MLAHDQPPQVYQAAFPFQVSPSLWGDTEFWLFDGRLTFPFPKLKDVSPFSCLILKDIPLSALPLPFSGYQHHIVREFQFL